MHYDVFPNWQTEETYYNVFSDWKKKYYPVEYLRETIEEILWLDTKNGIELVALLHFCSDIDYYAIQNALIVGLGE